GSSSGGSESAPSAIGLITFGTKQTGKRSAGKPHAAFDVAGAGNVTMVAGLRSLAKAMELPPEPTVRAPAPDPTCERPVVQFHRPTHPGCGRRADCRLPPLPTRLIFRDKIGQMPNNSVYVALLDQRPRPAQPRIDAMAVRDGCGENLDLLVVGGEHVFSRHHDFLEQLLARAQSGKADIDVVVRGEPGKAYQVFGEMDNLHRFAHVEDKDLGSVPHRRGLQNELDSFRDGHEVAANFGMSHRHWTTFRDLVLEYGDHASITRQNVAETDGYELG